MDSFKISLVSFKLVKEKKSQKQKYKFWEATLFSFGQPLDCVFLVRSRGKVLLQTWENTA